MEKQEEECVIIKKALKIIQDYKSNYDSDANAPKIDEYVKSVDVDDPILKLQQKMGYATDVLEAIFVIKKSQLLRLR